MTADIDAVLSRLRERPECRDAVEVIEELAGRTEFVRGLLRDARQGCEEARAERDRLREACFEASKRLYGSLARHRDLDLDLVSYRHLLEASTILNVALDAALGESPVPDEPTSDESFEHVGHGEGMSMFIGHVSGCPACEATRRKMLDEQTERFMERVKADAQPGPKHAAAPFGPTGEEQDR